MRRKRSRHDALAVEYLGEGAKVMLARPKYPDGNGGFTYPAGARGKVVRKETRNTWLVDMDKPAMTNLARLELHIDDFTVVREGQI